VTGAIVPDTSAWIEFLRGTGSRADRTIDQLLGEPQRLIVTGPVLLELLAGVTPHRERERLRSTLATCAYEPAEDPWDFEDAAALYRTCRAAGLTLRGHVDCLIATVAMRVGASVLSVDDDFRRIAKHAPLELA